MLTRLDVLKLEFIYRVIEMHDKKLFLSLYQIESVIINDTIDEENLLTYVSSYFDTARLEDITAYYRTIDANYRISEKKELTSKEIDYLFEQADFQMSQKNA